MAQILNMLGNSSNMNNLNWNPVVLKKKKLVKPLEIAILGASLQKKEPIWARPKTNIFFSEITKADYKLSKTFHFIKISCFG